MDALSSSAIHRGCAGLIVTILFFFPFAPVNSSPHNGTIPPPQKPNILLIMLDDAGAQYMDIAHTPTIDALAARGRNYTMAFANSTGCNPSRVSFATGLLPTCVDAMEEHFDWRAIMNQCAPGLGDNVKTLYKTFAEAGYYTAAIGKIMHTVEQQTPEFDESAFMWAIDILPEVANKPVSGLTDFYAAMPGEWRDWGRMENMRGPNGETFGETDLMDARIANLAAQRIDQLPQPFFAAVGMAAPHLPRYAPSRLVDKYLDAPLPDVLMNDPGDLGAYGKSSSVNNAQNRTVVSEILAHPSRWREFNAIYYASIEFADEQVGRILASVPENTIVVVWSDHGYHLGQKLRIEKGALWREDYHVPLIIAGPGIAPATISDVTNSTEVYPMLLELAGLAPTDGIDRTPIGDGFVQFVGNVAVDDSKKAIIQYKDGIEREFYDMTVDPQQWRNLTPEPEYVNRLSSYLP